jgi:hypothetical protein
MEKQEREELRAVAADGFPISPTRVLDLFADYDALAKSHAHADKHRVALEARLAEVEADLAHCRHTRRLQADARQKERAKLDSLQAQYEDMKQERDMFAEKLAEAEEDRERLEGMTLRLAEAEARAEEAESSREQAYYALAYIQREGPRITDISAEWPEVRMSVPGGFVTGHDLVQCVERAAEIDAAREGSDADTGGAVRSQARQEGEGRIMKAHLKKSTVLKACEAILGEKTYHAMETVRAPVPSLLNMAAMNAFLQDLRTAHASTVRLALLELNQEGFIEYEPEDLGL